MKKIIGLVLLLVIGFVGYQVYSGFSGANSKPSFASLPREEQAKRRVEAQELVKTVENIAKDAKSGQPKNFSVSASEDQLNTLLQDRLRVRNLPIENPQFRITDGSIQLQGQAKYNGFNVPVALTGKPTIKSDGTIDFTVDSLTLSGLPAPGQWKEKAQKAIAEGLPKAFGAAPNVRFNGVELQDGRMTVSGKTN